MKKLLITFECLCLLIAGSFSISGVPRLFQTKINKEVLTNDDVLSLSKRGFRKSFIIKKIRSSETDFDTRPEQLEQLKSNGVSDAVIVVMISRQREQAATTGQERSSSGVAAPHRSKGSTISAQPGLTPAQVEDQEKATRRANLPVPIKPGGSQSNAYPENPGVQPVLNPATESAPAKPSISPATTSRSKKRKRKTPHGRRVKTDRQPPGD